MKTQVQCWVNDKRLFAFGLEHMEPERARDIAIGLLETQLEKRILGREHQMAGSVVRILVAPTPLSLIDDDDEENQSEF